MLDPARHPLCPCRRIARGSIARLHYSMPWPRSSALRNRRGRQVQNEAGYFGQNEPNWDFPWENNDRFLGNEPKHVFCNSIKDIVMDLAPDSENMPASATPRDVACID